MNENQKKIEELKMMEKKTQIQTKKKINKKKVCLVLLCVLIVIYASMLIKDTFSRYQSNATADSNVDVAFWIVSDTVQSQDVFFEGLLPGESKECTFTVSNNNGTVRTNTALTYDIIITTTTNLPLTYSFSYREPFFNEFTIWQPNPSTDRLYQDDDGTYYREIIFKGFEFGCFDDEFVEFYLQAEFPGEYDDVKLADLIECVNVKIDAKQKIDE